MEDTGATVTTRPPAPLIAIIEDDPNIRGMLELLLTQAGYQTLLFTESEPAYASIRRTQPQLVILDLWLEQPASGWRLLRQLRQDTATQQLPVIVCSAHPFMLAEIAHFLTGPHYAFLHKPFQINDLLATIQAHIAAPRSAP